MQNINKRMCLVAHTVFTHRVFARTTRSKLTVQHGGLAGKDILWYTREKKDDQEQRLRDELQAIKEREEDLMLEVRPGRIRR